MGTANLSDIVSNQTAANPVQTPVVQAPATGGTANLSDIVSNSGPAQPSLGSRIWQGVTESAPYQAVAGALKPPQTHAEEGIMAVGGIPALQAWRAATGIVDSVKNLTKASADEYPQAKQDFQRTVQDFHNKDWWNAASDAVSTGTDVLGITQPEMAAPAQNIRELSEGARPNGNLATPLTRQVVDAATVLAPEAAEEAPSAAAEIAAKAKQTVVPTTEVAGEDFATRPFRSGTNETAGTQAVKNIADQTTQSAGATPTAQPTSLRDVFAEPIQARTAVAKTFYKGLDDASDGQWTANQNALKNVRRDIQMKSGISEDVDNTLNARKLQLEWQQEQIIDKAVQNGMPEDVAQQARKNWEAKSRLEDIQDIFNKKSNVSGARPEMTTPGVTLPPEKYNFKGIARDLNATDPDDLTLALGKEGAQNLVTAANLAAKQGWAASKFAKVVGSLLNHMALYGLASEVAGRVLK